jgi:hypothetical protein
MFGYFAYFVCEAHELYDKRKRVTQFRKRSESIPFQVRKMEGYPSRRSSIREREESPEEIERPGRHHKKRPRKNKVHKT